MPLPKPAKKICAPTGRPKAARERERYSELAQTLRRERRKGQLTLEQAEVLRRLKALGY